MKIAQIYNPLTRVLNKDIDKLARETGIMKRRNKISGWSLSQGLVTCWMQNPQATETEIAQYVGQASGCSITPQAVNARMTEATAGFLLQVLQKAAATMVQSTAGTQTLLDRFHEVNVSDSTVVTLPDGLERIWAGCGNQRGQGRAGVKLQVQWELRTGRLSKLTLHAARETDRRAPVQKAEITPNSLRLADLGYFSLDVFERTAAAGAFWLSRYLPGVHLYTTDGEKLDLVKWLKRHCRRGEDVDMPVVVGRERRVSARLVAVAVPSEVAAERRRKLREKAKKKSQKMSELSLMLADWNLFLTNVPVTMLNGEEVLIISRMRWQVELLFKLWKSIGGIDESRSKKPFRRLCELYAKLLGQIIQHWMVITVSWPYVDRSMTKVAKAIRPHIHALMNAVRCGSSRLATEALTSMQIAASSACRISRRSSKSAFQLLTG